MSKTSGQTPGDAARAVGGAPHSADAGRSAGMEPAADTGHASDPGHDGAGARAAGAPVATDAADAARAGDDRPAVLLVLCTCPDEPTAARISATLVEERLAACVNRVPGMRSTYRWENQVQDEPEVLLIIKTTQERFAALEMRLKALHPYEVPEIIGIPVTAGSAGYLTWVAQESV